MIINGVSVVLTWNETKVEAEGMSISWLTFVEKDHVMISIPDRSVCTKLLCSNKEFSINVLYQGQENVAKYFGGNSVSKPKALKNNFVKKLENGFPALEYCCGTYFCLIHKVVQLNEQVVVIGKIYGHLTNTDKKPLTYNKNHYQKI